MLSINGTTNYSTARIDGVIFTDTSSEIEKIKEDITGITYNDVTDTTNIDNNVNITNDLTAQGNITQTTGTLSIPNFANVGNTLSDFSNRLQGISYSSAGDITTIDNSVRVNKDFTVKGYFNIDQIYSSAILTLDTDGGIDIIGGGVKASGDIIQSTGIITQSGGGTNAMKAITLNNNNNLTTSGTGIISQTGTGINSLKNTNIVGDLTTTTFKTERALLGYQTDEFINKDDELRLYFPLDTILGSAFRLHNYNKYFVNGTYTSVPMTNTGTLTNSNQVGQVGNTSFEYTNGRYFWNYTGSNYDCNYLSFGGWVKAFTSTTSSRLYFVNVNGTTADATIDVDVGGNMYFTCDGTYFINTTIQATSTNNVWFHVFVVIDGTSQKVYRNGTLINTTTRTLFTANSVATFGMGRTSLMGTSNIDDLRLYSRALTDAEVASVFAYRGSLTEPYPIKMNGLVMIGDRIDQNNATRAVNIRDQNGIISIARYVGGQAGFELLTYGQATGTRTSNVLCLGGNDGGDAFQVLLRQNGIDNFVFQVSASLCQVNAPMRVIGNLRIDGGITQQTSTSTNQMSAITLYPNQDFTQLGSGIINQSRVATPVIGINSNTYTLAGQTWISSASSTYNNSPIYYAFDNTSQFYHSAVTYSNGLYIGGASTIIVGIGTIAGEWLQIQFPYQFVLTDYTLIERGGGFAVRLPRVFYIVGSNDGTTWNSLDYQSYGATPVTPISNSINNPTTAYSYYRIVVNEIYPGASGNAFNLNEWQMNGNHIGTNELKTTNITGTLAITGYSNVKSTLDTLSSATTDITYNAGTDTTTINNNTSITGILSIPSYSNVKSTLDTFSTTSTAITGISYNSSTDTTTIDNNVKINKNLKLEDNTVVLTGPTGYVMDECEKHTFLYSVNRPIGAPFRTIRTTSFDALNINADFNTPSGRYTFQLVKIFKGVTYTGAFMINSSVGSNGHPAQMALMEAGIGVVSKPLERLAVTNTFTTSGSTLHYAPFRTPYTATETREAYIGYVITAVALNPVVRGAAISYNNNYKITTCQTGSLTSLCCGYSGSTTASFDTMGTFLNPSQAMTAFSTQMYCGLYTDT